MSEQEAIVEVVRALCWTAVGLGAAWMFARGRG